MSGSQAVRFDELSPELQERVRQRAANPYLLATVSYYDGSDTADVQLRIPHSSDFHNDDVHFSELATQIVLAADETLATLIVDVGQLPPEYSGGPEMRNTDGELPALTLAIRMDSPQKGRSEIGLYCPDSSGLRRRIAAGDSLHDIAVQVSAAMRVALRQPGVRSSLPAKR